MKARDAVLLRLGTRYTGVPIVCSVDVDDSGREARRVE